MKESLKGLRRLTANRSSQRQFAQTSWQRTLVVVWVAEFVALIGFAVVIPFLPFYVQELGVSDPDQVKFWSGLVLSAHAITMGIFAPIWGSLADRHGRKLMLERAMFGGAVVLTLMAFARNPQQLLALRMLQGCLTGTVPAATTLVASVVPRERTGFALGWLQMGMFAGVSLGPLVGGLIADSLGYRASFVFTGACLFLAGLGVFFFVQEGFERPQTRPGERRPRWWDGLGMVFRSRDLLVVLATRLLTRTGTRVTGPVLPLFIAALLPAGSRVATMTGIVIGASAIASSIGAAILGRTGDQVGYRRVLLTSAVAAALFYGLQAAVSNTAQLILLQLCVGAALSGTLSSLTALLATLAPQGQQGAVYGVDTSVVSGANAIGPMLGAALAVALGNRAAFLLAAAVFVLSAAVIGWLLPEPQPDAGAPVDAVPVPQGQPARPVETR
jgi:DHA1 family multidrug resistance protein-like MFS transporter